MADKVNGKSYAGFRSAHGVWKPAVRTIWPCSRGTGAETTGTSVPLPPLEVTEAEGWDISEFWFLSHFGFWEEDVFTGDN